MLPFSGLQMRKDIHREMVLAAPIDQVWDAITDQSALSQWYMRTEDFQPQVGCKFVFTDRPQGKWDGKVHGEVLEVEAPHRLVYTFWGNQMSSKTRVEWKLSAEGNATRVVIDHTGFEGFGDWLMGQIISFGWKKFLRALREHVE